MSVRSLCASLFPVPSILAATLKFNLSSKVKLMSADFVSQTQALLNTANLHEASIDVSSNSLVRVCVSGAVVHGEERSTEGSDARLRAKPRTSSTFSLLGLERLQVANVIYFFQFGSTIFICVLQRSSIATMANTTAPTSRLAQALTRSYVPLI